MGTTTTIARAANVVCEDSFPETEKLAELLEKPLRKRGEFPAPLARKVWTSRLTGPGRLRATWRRASGRYLSCRQISGLRAAALLGATPVRAPFPNASERRE